MVDKFRIKIEKSHLIGQNPFLLLRSAINIIVHNPVILYPSALLAFIQLLFLEILYFAPQYPLNQFFAPLFRQVWAEDYLHYPLNLLLIPKIFYYLQIIIYLFVGSFMLAVTSKIIVILNEHPRVNFREVFKEIWGSYVHIFAASLITLYLFQFLAKGYVSLLEAIITHNPFGQTVFFWKQMLLWTIPYGQFLVGIFATTVTVYLIPILVIDKTKIVKALASNCSILFSALPLTILTVSLPTLLYLPLHMARNNIALLINYFGPEIQILVIIISIFSTLAIDLIVLASASVYYLFLREKQ